MFGFFKRKTNTNADKFNTVLAEKVSTVRENNMKAIIETTAGGETLLRYGDGTPVATYSRKRDAVRGAARRGLTLIGN